ncbi:MAG TPA: tetratricopeptide repeat protein [Pyrinomonadaceae bacterium]
MAPVPVEKRGDRPSIAVRVLPLNYLVVLLLVSFVAAFLLYIGVDIGAFALLAVVWIAIPLMILHDRIVFNGRRITRTGLVPRLWARLTSTRDRIKLNDVEHVQTTILRTIKRGGNLIYTYRTTFFGKGKAFTIHSGSRSYRAFIEAVFPKLNESVMDSRSLDLRDHLDERIKVKRRAVEASIPSAEVLEGTLREPLPKLPDTDGSVSPDKAAALHRLANELRVSGLLPQAIEAFRRALLLMPKNARLLLDFSLCLRSYAAVFRDRDADKKARALIRLAERRAGDDGQLLTEIGEGYFQFGELRRAGATFRKAIERAGSRFRSLIGLAELALHEGKIAHVILNFSAARDLADSPAARRWATHEIDYFSRLNSDEEYMELEISRMNLLDTLAVVRRSALRIAMVGFPVIVVGILVEVHLIANIGWAVSLIAFAVWSVVILMSHMLAARIPYELVEDK